MTTRLVYFFILPMALSFFSTRVSAESASVSYQSTKSLTDAMMGRDQICQTLKVNPKCIDARLQMKAQMGLTVIGCMAQQQALKCDDFIAKNPEYKEKRMRCDPYDVCRNALESTFVRGCAANAGETLAALREVAACGTNWACAKKHFPALDEATFKKIGMHLIPGYGLYHLVKGIYDGAAEDYKKYPHMACLSPELQAQFSCHLLTSYGGMLIPAGGAVVKGVSLAGKALSMAAVEEALVAADVRGAAAVSEEVASGGAGKRAVEAWHAHESEEKFRQRLLHYDPTTDEQRLKMMDFVRSTKARGVQIFDEEFAGAKDLNGKINKDTVTALAAQRKEILLSKFKLFAEKHKDILDIGPIYSDFKPLRVAIVPKTAAMRAAGFPKSVFDDLQKMVDETNVEMDQKIKALGLKTESSAKLFRAGLDRSADEANLNGRFAQAGRIARSDDPAILKAKEKAYGDLRAQGTRLIQSLDAPSPLIEIKNRSAILKPDVFDIIKKAKGSPQDIRATLNHLYPGLNVSDEGIKQMINYANLTDRFQPGIWSSTRTVASLSDAKYGGISIDVKGMGAHNAYQTALKAVTCTSPSQLVTCTRDGERAVTREFQSRLSKIRDIALKNCADAGVKCSVNISGDDIKIIPLDKKLPPGVALKNIEAVNDNVGPGLIRQAEILPGLKAADRELTATHGEKIESLLAVNLSRGPLAAKAKLTTFHVRMETNASGLGAVRITALGPGLKQMTAEESAALQEAYKQAVADMNKIDPSHAYILSPP